MKSRVLKKISNQLYKPCNMCNKFVPGGEWEYKPYQFVPDYFPDTLKICKKCVYREVYGTRNVKKAIKLKLLDKMNYDFSDEAPKVE